MDKLDKMYAEWQEAESRAAQWREYHRECTELSDTPSGRERERYLFLKASFSPAYFSGSAAYRREHLGHQETSARVLKCLKCLGGIGMLMRIHSSESHQSDMC